MNHGQFSQKKKAYFLHNISLSWHSLSNQNTFYLSPDWTVSEVQNICKKKKACSTERINKHRIFKKIPFETPFFRIARKKNMNVTSNFIQRKEVVRITELNYLGNISKWGLIFNVLNHRVHLLEITSYLSRYHTFLSFKLKQTYTYEKGLG